LPLGVRSLELLARLIRRIPRHNACRLASRTTRNMLCDWLAPAKPQPAAMAHELSFAAETTTDADYANRRNFFKVELRSKDDQHVIRLLHAGNRIDAARAVFNAAVRHRPRGRYTIRQRCRVVEQWPKSNAD
jgi:hypothetical protein